MRLLARPRKSVGDGAGAGSLWDGANAESLWEGADTESLWDGADTESLWASGIRVHGKILGQYFQYPAAEIRQVVRFPAGDEMAVDHDGGILPHGARIFQVVFNAR